MIFVTVGTNHAPFDRLVRPFANWQGEEEVLVQHGPAPLSSTPTMRCVPFLSYEENLRGLALARVVVTHAGVGSILSALAQGKVPVVVARLSRFGEAVDDHQVGLATRLSAEGLVRLVDLEADGPQALLAAISAPEEHVPPASARRLDLTRDLRAYVEAAVAR